jgi:hypothetical protein
VNAEMQRLRRELSEEHEKVQRLSSQLSTNVSPPFSLRFQPIGERLRSLPIGQA